MTSPAIPDSALAAVVTGYGEPIEVREVPVPKEIEPGALLVEIDTCSLCGTDAHLWKGELAIPADLPVILGHEMTGTVVAAGSGADTDSVNQPLRVGDRVVWAHTDCGRCRYCAAGMPTLCQNKRMYMYESCEKFPYLMGGFAQYGYVLPDSGRVRVPTEIAPPLASLTACALRSVVNAFDQTGPLDANDTVLIQGTGPLGLLAVGICRTLGVRQISVIGAPDDRLALATDLGADLTLSIEDTDTEQRRAALLDATDGLGPDVAFEFSGNPMAFAEGLDLTARGGRYVVVGQLGGQDAVVRPGLITAKNLRVIGSFSGAIEHYWKGLRFLQRHQHALPFERILTGSYPLDQVGTAIDAMVAGREIKPLVVPPH